MVQVEFVKIRGTETVNGAAMTPAPKVLQMHKYNQRLQRNINIMGAVCVILLLMTTILSWWFLWLVAVCLLFVWAEHRCLIRIPRAQLYFVSTRRDLTDEEKNYIRHILRTN